MHFQKVRGLGKKGEVVRLKVIFAALASVVLLAACENGKIAEEKKESSPNTVAKMTERAPLAAFGEPFDCAPEYNRCYRMDALLASRHLKAAALCDGKRRLYMNHFVNNGTFQDELHSVLFVMVEPGLVSAMGGLYAVQSGETKEVTYMEWASQAMTLSNLKWREEVNKRAPNAFRFMANHEQGDCEVLNR